MQNNCKPLKNQEWNQFINLNQVSNYRLECIAYKMKANQLLTERELAIYQAKASLIEQILKTI
jgi:hypothetical protein